MMSINTNSRRFRPRTIYQDADTPDYCIEVAFQPPTLDREMAYRVYAFLEELVSGLRAFNCEPIEDLPDMPVDWAARWMAAGWAFHGFKGRGAGR